MATASTAVIYSYAYNGNDDVKGKYTRKFKFLDIKLRIVVNIWI